MFLARSNLCSKSAAARFSPSTTQLMKRSLSVSTAVDPQPLNGSKNLKWEMVGDTGIAYFTLDQEGEKVNMFSSALQSDMEDMLKTIESTPSIKAAVLASGKPGCFVAGADIKELNRCNTAAEAQALSKEGQRFLNELENCSKPIVAAIDGAALGGGLEIALACHHRIATTNPKTKLGLVEVKIGLLPGAGGTQRFPKYAGLVEGLTACTTGKEYKADKAKKIGIVHSVADPNALRDAAIQAALGLADGSIKRNATKNRGMMGKIMDTPMARNFIFSQATKTAAKQGKDYPAVQTIIDTIKAGVEGGMEKGLAVESENFGKLTQTSVSDSLMGLFHGATALKKNRFGKPEREIKTVGVLGAGLMGAGVAQVTSAFAKKKVLLKDRDLAGLGRGQKQIDDNLSLSLKKRKISKHKKDTIQSSIVGLYEDDNIWPKHFNNCDLVVEAVFEDLGVKHAVIQAMEEHLPEHAIFATNTSAIPIRDVAKGSKRPENVLGMHYFSPVDMMPLLEIITHEGTSKDTTAAAVDLGLKQGKYVIVVKDVPGFYVNRCLGPYMAEVMALVTEGVPLKDIDKAMKDYGFPMGPITLADMVGIDVAMHVNETLSGDLGIRMHGSEQGLQLMKQMLDKGFAGEKSGKGFWLPKPKKKKGLMSMLSSPEPRQTNPEVETMIKTFVDKNGGPKHSAPSKEGSNKDANGADLHQTLQDRMASRFLIEAAMCLQDEIIENPVDGDIGAIMGIGFPPFKGGPFRYMDQVGVDKVVDTMSKLRDTHGEHFEPPQILVDYAKAGKKFHS